MHYNRLPRSIVVANGKGGVGKTTTCVNLAYEAARRGAPVTVLDLDPQGTAAESFGIEDHDNGKSILAACLEVGDIQFSRTTQPNLRCIAGGTEVRALSQIATIQGNGDPNYLASKLVKAIKPHLRVGEWLFIDTEPAIGTPLTDAAFLIGEHLISVTGFDKFEMKGVEKVFRRLVDIDHTNGTLINPLGILFNGIKIGSAKSKLAEKTAWFDERIGDTMPVFETFIREATKATEDSRETGLALAELQELAETADLPPWYEQVKTGQRTVSFAANTRDIADDYKRLADEMITRQNRPATRDTMEHAHV